MAITACDAGGTGWSHDGGGGRYRCGVVLGGRCRCGGIGGDTTYRYGIRGANHRATADTSVNIAVATHVADFIASLCRLMKKYSNESSLQAP